MCIIDEIDMVMHPLTSEQNFPIGMKEEIDMGPLRWALPMHIMELIFAAAPGTEASAPPPHVDDRTAAIMAAPRTELMTVFKQGLTARKLQIVPHLTILDIEFYSESCLKPIADWVAG